MKFKPGVLRKRIASLILIWSLVFGSSLISKKALADSGDLTGAILITFAAGKGLSTISANALEELELKEWKDTKTQSTTQLGDQCGFLYEAHLVGDISTNYLWLTLKNNTQNQVSFNPMDLDFKFSKGIIRKPDLFRFNEVIFEKGRLYNVLLPLPSKDDFKQEKSLNINIPLKTETVTCEMNIEMQRNPNIPDSLRTTVSMDKVDFEVGVGPSGTFGRIGQLTKSRFGISESFKADIYGPNGGGVYFGVRSFGNQKISAAAAVSEGLSNTLETTMTELQIGYVERFFIDQEDQIHLSIGLSSLSIRFNSPQQTIAEYHATGFDGQLFYQRYFKKKKSGVWKGNYYWGLIAAGSYYPQGEKMKDQNSLSGETATGLLVLGFGG